MLPRAILDCSTGVLFGRLGAEAEPIAFYEQLVQAPEFRDPIAWSDIDPDGFDGLVLPGGHAPGMRQYLASTALQDKVAAYWQLDRPVGAICHGVIVLARATDPATGRSVIADKRTTCLPEVHGARRRSTPPPGGLGATTAPTPRTSKTRSSRRSTMPGSSCAVPEAPSAATPATIAMRSWSRTGNYLSARWPGDAYLFAERFDELLTRADRRAPAETSPG